MVFLVGEIGVNWDGDFDLLRNIMQKCKEIGVDAIKFQAFNNEIIAGHPQAERLLKSAITKMNVRQIDEMAKEINLEWFCTPMYPEAVDFLEPYVNRFKIRYSDGIKIVEGKSSELLDKIFKTNKQIIISSQKNPNTSKFYNDSRISWLYCVPKYPCDLSELNFTDLGSFGGFSNHCPNIIAPLSASILGAKIIEVHITADKSSDFLDNNVSFDYDELTELVKLIRSYEKIKND
jgi:sialic acid synthase SpsE